MNKVIFIFLPFLLAPSLAFAEQIAIKTKDGDIVHWKDYWQDKDTGNYCTDIPRGEFCLDKSDIVQVHKGKDAARLEKTTRRWTNTASGRSLDIIARESQTTASAPAMSPPPAGSKVSANTNRLNNQRTSHYAPASNNHVSQPNRRGST